LAYVKIAIISSAAVGWGRVGRRSLEAQQRASQFAYRFVTFANDTSISLLWVSHLGAPAAHTVLFALLIHV